MGALGQRPDGRSGAACAAARFAHFGKACANGRILVAGDSLLVADLVCDALREHGYSIVGPAGDLATACELAQTADLDGAVLDFKLDNDFCFPVAVHLKARGVPFIALTGYPKWRDFPAGLEPASWISKPVDRADLIRAVDLILAARRSHGDPQTASLPPPTSASEQVPKERDHVRVKPHMHSGEAEDMTTSMCNFLPASPSNREPAAGAAHGNGKRVRVFLVEGDSHCRAMLSALLTRQGFDVQSFDEDRALCESLAGDSEASRPHSPAGDVACGNLALNQSQRRAWWNGSVVPLSAGELEIVLLLATNAGRYVGHRAIYDCLHYEGFLAGNGDNGFCVNVRSAIRRIRQKFRAVDSNFCEIENSWAFGYCWRQDPPEMPPGP